MASQIVGTKTEKITDTAYKPNLTDKVYNEVLSELINKRWIAGDKMPTESELMEQFGVSRNTVRQVIHRLVALGILESRQGSGTYVKEPDLSYVISFLAPYVFMGHYEIIHLEQYRKAIEVEAARIAARQATYREIRDLEQYLVRLEEVEGDAQAYYTVDMDFHIEISKISGNNMFYRTMVLLKSILHDGLYDYMERFGTDGSMRGHREIYNAILNHDPDLAAKTMDKHLGLLVIRL